jgi:predicted amidohydrolase YtcJ
MGAAWGNHADDRTGSIEAGKLADLVVLDRDIARERPDRIADARVLLTLVEGQPVHGDPDLEG